MLNTGGHRVVKDERTVEDDGMAYRSGPWGTPSTGAGRGGPRVLERSGGDPSTGAGRGGPRVPERAVGDRSVVVETQVLECSGGDPSTGAGSGGTPSTGA
ncbi:hypothetical protein chiPu_0000295 [Chiloscyllium punctatum]|uniref:Uncharacterized protein n=1 Tax=Chiloscyllium punctatum TaxID=137246 RepID=A0A401RUW1_CHIPU|nr:hypothetical protein [Chiloscyllium punctatum]